MDRNGAGPHCTKWFKKKFGGKALIKSLIEEFWADGRKEWAFLVLDSLFWNDRKFCKEWESACNTVYKKYQVTKTDYLKKTLQLESFFKELQEVDVKFVEFYLK